MRQPTRNAARAAIEASINRFGWHTYVVSGGDATPRFAYTIGLFSQIGRELVLAGAAYYSLAQAKRIINEVAEKAKSGEYASMTSIVLNSLGTFTLRTAHLSWTKALMLGALDYFGLTQVPALQIVPDSNHMTVDVPDMSRPLDTTVEPVWQWLQSPWAEPVPESSIVTTNLQALQGRRITEAARWEVDQWECFAGPGPDVRREDARVIPLGTLLAVDPTLAAVVRLPVGGAIWRDETEATWHKWK